MSKRVSLIALLGVLLGIFLTHVSWVRKDNGYLLVIDANEFDVLGNMRSSWTKATRNCGDVSRLASQDESYLAAENLIKNYSLPNSKALKIASVWAIDSWILVEVEFSDLLPAVVVIKKTEQGAAIVPNAIWSGYTKPWLAAPHIRQYLYRQASDAPTALFNCFEPQSSSFK